MEDDFAGCCHHYVSTGSSNHDSTDMGLQQLELYSTTLRYVGATARHDQQVYACAKSDSPRLRGILERGKGLPYIECLIRH